VANIIHNFGRTDQLDRQQLVRLCQSIARVCGLTVIDPCDASSQSPAIKDANFTEDLQIKMTPMHHWASRRINVAIGTRQVLSKR
jgi:hypothetical protein